MVLCLIVGCDSKSVRDKGLYSTRVPSVVTNQGEEAQKISKERRSREVNAFVIGFPEGGGSRADVGEYGDFATNFSPCGGGNVGTMVTLFRHGKSFSNDIKKDKRLTNYT